MLSLFHCRKINMQKKFLLLAVALALAVPVRSLAREDTQLDDGWRFQSGDATNAIKSTFDDRGWSKVSIPHNWGWEDAQAGKDFYRGPGWYRHELNINATPGKRFFLASRRRARWRMFM